VRSRIPFPYGAKGPNTAGIKQSDEVTEVEKEFMEKEQFVEQVRNCLPDGNYIIENRCTGCTVCVEYCPVKYPDQFNKGISNNKAIHIYFAQATPLVTYIDENCLYLQDMKVVSGISKTKKAGQCL
jgi:heterodisulfide reductase subunit A-like polyferredoxin